VSTAATTPVRSTGTTPEREELLRNYLVLVRSFFLKDVRVRYAGSLMGFFWTVVHPLLELMTYTFVFTVIIGVSFHKGYSTGTNALFLFCGMIPWLSVSESMNRCTSAFRDNAPLIKKLRFPPSVLCTYIVLVEGFNQLVRFALLCIAALIIGRGLSLDLLLVLPILVMQLLFTQGLGMLLATTQVFFRDIKHLLGPALMIWMFITPIFYPESLFPPKFSPVLMLNPLSHLVGIYRELILNHQFPAWGSVVIFGTSAVLTFALGAFTFHRHSHEFPDLV
jgi:ABC-type polysaccharide/polyol phosphate export permease